MANQTKQKGRVNYGQRFIRLCKLLYLEHGTLAGVTTALKRRGYKHPPNRKTLAAWRDEGNWDEALHLNDLFLHNADDDDRDKLAQLIEEIEVMKTVAKKKIVIESSGTLEIKDTTSQDFYAYNRLAETLGKLLENQRRAMAAEAVKTPVEAIFNALKKHPKIGELLSKKSVLEELNGLIAEEKLSLARKEIGLA